MDVFLRKENIARFQKMLAETTNENLRFRISRLLAEEVAKLSADDDTPTLKD